MDLSSRPKFQPGQLLTEFPGPAWNELMDMLEWYRRTVPFGRDTKHEPPRYRRCNAIRIKNATESNLNAGDIVAIDDSVYDPGEEDELEQFRGEPIFVGTAPTFPADIGRFAVLLEPIEADGIGDAAIDGVVACKVYMDKQGRPFADIEPDGIGPTTHLTAGEFGGAEILYVEDQDEDAEEWEYGTKEALVRIGSFSDPDLVVSWEGNLEFGTPKTAKVHDASGPTERTILLKGSILGSFSGQLLAIVTPGEMALAHFVRTSGVYELGANTRMFESINDP
jgi:hypothetical protein